MLSATGEKSASGVGIKTQPSPFFIRAGGKHDQARDPEKTQEDMDEVLDPTTSLGFGCTHPPSFLPTSFHHPKLSLSSSLGGQLSPCSQALPPSLPP
jgi:hypothetical protein